MLKFRFLVYIMMCILMLNLVSAATIYGTIYDFSLKKVNNARVEINTQPKQLIIAQNGTYSFNVPKGSYTLKAQLLQKNTVIASVQENITIEQDGSYILDLMLFPDVEEGVENIELEVNENIAEPSKTNNFLIGGIVTLIVVIIIGYLLYYQKKSSKTWIEVKHEKEKPEESHDEYLEKIIKILKQEDGRITQKELRKHLPFSEGKISLMITELEHKGIVERIKKGRGNIVILKRK